MTNEIFKWLRKALVQFQWLLKVNIYRICSFHLIRLNLTLYCKFFEMHIFIPLLSVQMSWYHIQGLCGSPSDIIKG